MVTHNLYICMYYLAALQTAHGWFLKPLKLEEKEDLFEAKKQKELLKKLDFLNLFHDKEEKKADEWQKFKQWWDEKKQKELSFFEDKKEKELSFFEDKKEKELSFFEDKKEKELAKKSKKKSKSKKTTVKPCYSSYEEQPTYSYPAEEEQEEEESEEVTEKPYRQSHSSKSYPKPTYYDRREQDSGEDNIRYFT
ncbi:hypothetical protein KR009_007695 [Drosophila setifemur]|nr:hypothetical protein KR009_007695 [Drosophila setifemur]